MRIVVPALLLMAFASFDIVAVECADVTDDGERLRCYDAQNGRDREVPTGAAAATGVVPGTEPTVEAGGGSFDGATAQEAVGREPTVGEDRSFPNAEKGHVQEGKREKAKPEIRKVVRITQRGTDRRLIYELDNGERWGQTKTQVVSIRENDEIVIRRSLTGRSRISTLKGASAWVELLP